MSEEIVNEIPVQEIQSEEKTTEQKNQEAAKHAAQTQIVRQTLIKDAYSHYHKLLQALQSLPVQQDFQGFITGYTHLDTGMMWIEKMIGVAPLKTVAPQEKKDQNLTEPKEENSEKSERNPEESIENN